MTKNWVLRFALIFLAMLAAFVFLALARKADETKRELDRLGHEFRAKEQQQSFFMGTVLGRVQALEQKAEG